MLVPFNRTFGTKRYSSSCFSKKQLQVEVGKRCVFFWRLTFAEVNLGDHLPSFNSDRFGRLDDCWMQWKLPSRGSRLAARCLVPLILIDMGVSKNMGKPPKSSILVRLKVFHYFHHPFWGVFPLFLETSIKKITNSSDPMRDLRMREEMERVWGPQCF